MMKMFYNAATAIGVSVAAKRAMHSSAIGLEGYLSNHHFTFKPYSSSVNL